MKTELRLSNSEMVEFRRCRRKWWLSTYRRLGPRVEPGPMTSLSIGNLVHDALAAYYDPADGSDPVEYVKAIIEQDIDAYPTYTDDLIKERDLVTIMLSGYLEWLAESGADADLKILGSETIMDVPLVPGVRLISKLDAPVERISDGAKLAIEHKTVGSLDQRLPVAKLDTQYLTEHLVRFLDAIEKGASPEEAYDQCQGVLLNMLRKVKRTATAKPPFYGREDIIHNLPELRNHWRHVLATAHEIEATRARLDAGESHHTAAPPNPTMNCTWDCPFFKVCVMFDDGSNVEGALEAIYEERDPLERYLAATPLE